MSLDMYDTIPDGMRKYLSHYGWNFNRKACDYAVSLMRVRNKANGRSERLVPMTREDVDTILASNSITLDRNKLMNHVYVANMCKADFLGSCIEDENHLAKYVKDVIDDVDAAEGSVMRCWYAKMVASGTPVDWDEIL